MTNESVSGGALQPRYKHVPGYSWWVLIVSMLTFMCFFIAYNTPNVFGAMIQEDLGIDAAQLSLCSTTAMLAFTIFPVIFARYAENIGIRKFVPICLSCNVISALLLFLPFFSTTYVGYLITRFIQGATGIMNGAIAAQLCRWFPKNMRGFATGIFMGFLGVGFTVTALYGNALLEAGFDWKISTIIMTLTTSVAMAIIYPLGLRDFESRYPEADSMDDLMPPVDEKRRSTRFDHLPKPATYAEMWRNGRMWMSAIFGATTAVIIYGLSYALPQFLMLDKGMDMIAANGIVAATFVWKILASPTGGLMSDHIFKGERWQTNAIGTVGCGVFLLILLTLDSMSAITVVVIIAFFFGSLYGGTYWTWPYELAQPQVSYAAGGFIVSIANIGALVSVPVCGILVNMYGGTAPILFIAVVALLGVIPAKLMKN